MTSITYDKSIIKSINVEDYNKYSHLTPKNIMNNVFPGAGRPCDDVKMFYSYFAEIERIAIDDDIVKACEEDECENIYLNFTEFIKTADNSIFDNIKDVYCLIKYPVRNPAFIHIQLHGSLTYDKLLYAYSVAYQTMYDIEENTNNKIFIPTSVLLNRSETDGLFGIWGHDIVDLEYDGNSELKIYDNFVIFSAGCSS